MAPGPEWSDSARSPGRMKRTAKSWYRRHQLFRELSRMTLQERSTGSETPFLMRPLGQSDSGPAVADRPQRGWSGLGWFWGQEVVLGWSWEFPSHFRDSVLFKVSEFQGLTTEEKERQWS